MGRSLSNSTREEERQREEANSCPAQRHGSRSAFWRARRHLCPAPTTCVHQSLSPRPAIRLNAPVQSSSRLVGCFSIRVASIAIRLPSAPPKERTCTRIPRWLSADSMTGAQLLYAARPATAPQTSHLQACPDIRSGIWRRVRWPGRANRSRRYASRSKIRSTTAAERSRRFTNTWRTIPWWVGRGDRAEAASRHPARRRNLERWSPRGSKAERLARLTTNRFSSPRSLLNEEVA